MAVEEDPVVPAGVVLDDVTSSKSDDFFCPVEASTVDSLDLVGTKSWTCNNRL